MSAGQIGRSQRDDLRAASAEASAMAETISVNGTAIGEEEIAREVQHHPAASFEEARREAALALVVRELLLVEARRLGLGGGDSSSDKPGFEEAIERLLDREFYVPEPDAAAFRRYYEQNRERFHSPDLFEAFHILILAPPDDAEVRTAARRKAETVLPALDEKPGDFAELARERSACASAAEGCVLGEITRGETAPEFEAAPAGLAPGEHIREPISTRYEFHIIKLHRRIDGRQLPFLAVRSRSRSICESVHGIRQSICT